MKDARTAETADARFFGRCAGCHARIIWAITGRGRPIPLDAEPEDNGNLHVDWLEWPHQPVATPNKDGGVGYQAHFVTCPQAAQFRRKR